MCDTVNLAARLEALNKELGTRIAVSNSTRDFVAGDFEFVEVAQTTIRGQSGTATVYSIDEGSECVGRDV
jgi:adenylate cyclase